VVSFLLDTNVLSELRKGGRCDARVAAWFAAVRDEDLHTSVLVVGEVRQGIEGIRRRDPQAAGLLERWLGRIVAQYEERILPVDRRVAEAWGRLNAAARLPAIDGLLAATALVHGLTLVTRNLKHVTRSGVPCLNPFGPD
jgi:toxin FitB